jgi:hypothetical protein
MMAKEGYVLGIRALAGASLALLVGCAADATGTDPTAAEPVSVEPAHATAKSSRDEVVTKDSSECSPLTCCFPPGGGWTSGTLEDDLQALGCTTPKTYATPGPDGPGSSWVDTQCPLDKFFPLVELVVKYERSPNFAQFVFSDCFPKDAWTIKYDPTCETCRF